ncbi:TIGR03862 family flavoprotein [Parvularcula sp. ZS-1/3]|uniref:TIGR03862 family flavoprotein n=1 Tax=Parvularcula mediterranea TaxID=2732508 RepID=A0A7Y3RN29_9PROT|nr:TIGR03862 family flavoprotein [Parvularcula mediterranea]NNU16665.1 TIGR03862 family flavoprotein [Parvularcula mediterranea]
MKVAVIGGGPAGLMAAEAASARGAEVSVYDQMPSLARKFLMAGKSGLNITHTEEAQQFLARYDAPLLREIVAAYGGSEAVREWMAGLGIEEAVGSSGRVFPLQMKASPLLRRWLARLEERGAVVRLKHRWSGWDGGTTVQFEGPDGEISVEADRLILACGGGSWRRLGSDGAWTEQFSSQGLETAPFRASNAGVLIGWSEHFRDRFEGEALKNVRFSAGGESNRGEAVITKRGLESGGIYPLTKYLLGGGTLTVDLLPDVSEAKLAAKLSVQKPKQSLSNRLRKGARLQGVKAGLLREALSPEELRDAGRLAAGIKALPLRVDGPVPLDEAISTAGGVPWTELSDGLELKAHRGVFCAGEMIDWDAPTGGYLLTACKATGWAAGQNAALP